VCAIVCNKISKCGIEGDGCFVDEVETQLREILLRDSQTQDIHYSEDKVSYEKLNGLLILASVCTKCQQK
jgi:hypothetical protein